jgi:hypothetical protein
MSNGFIYVVDAHFIDKIEEKKISWTQVPVNHSKRKIRYKIKNILTNALGSWFLHMEIDNSSI